MNKFPLIEDDYILIRSATAAINQAHHYNLRRVAAAIRTNTGRILTGIVLEADVSSLTVCAEPMALGKLLEYPGETVACIVCILMEQPGDESSIVIYPPCGRCRELITDYGPESYTIIREPDAAMLFKVKSIDLLPFKCRNYRQDPYDPVA